MGSISNHRVTFALVGGGAIAPLHAEYILSSTSCELVGIIDPFPPGRELAAKLMIPHFNSIQELIDKSVLKPEVYIVCVPSGLHVNVATEVLTVASPRAILVEKPFSTDSQSGQRLIDLAEMKGTKLAVGHHRRFYGSIVAARDVLSSGRLGQITAITGTWTCKKNESYYTAANWRISRAAGGGPVWTNFVHDIDVLHFLVDSTVIRLSVMPTLNRRNHDSVTKEDRIEEGAAVMLQFANGIIGTFIISDNVASPYGWESATGDNPDYAKATAPVDCYRIFGTKGTLTVPDGVLWTYSEAEASRKGCEVGWNIPMTRDVLDVRETIPFQEQTEHLARLASGTDSLPRCSGADGLAAVKVCEAIIAALEKRDAISVNLE